MKTCALAQEIDTETTLALPEKPPPLRRRLSDILRLCGAAILLAAGASFLAQGFAGWTSLERIFAFLVFTLSISGAGYLCGIKLKDPRGARVAVGIAALMIPVLMSQLGGLIYSLVGPPSNAPHFLIYRASSVLEASGAVAITLAAALPVAFFSFSVLARSTALPLTVLFMAVNLALLIPSRAPETIAFLTFLLLFVIISNDYRRLRGHAELLTKEGQFARFLPLAPIGILVGRSLVLYSATHELIASAMFAMIGGVLFFVVAPGVSIPRLSSFLRGTATVAFMLAWRTLVAGLFDESLWGYYYSGQAGFKVCTGTAICLAPATYDALRLFPLAVIAFLLGEISPGSGRGYRRLGVMMLLVAVLTTVPTVLGDSFSMAGIAWTLMAIASGLLAIVIGTSKNERAPLLAGITTLGLALIVHVASAFRMYTINPWVFLSVLGLITLVGSSYVECNFENIARRIRLLRQRIESR